MQHGIEVGGSLGQIAGGRQVGLPRHWPKSDVEFSRIRRRGMQPNRLAGGIMAGELSRRLYRRAGNRLRLVAAQLRADLVGRDRSRAQYLPLSVWSHRDNRRFDAIGTPAAIQHQFDPIAE